ncbi:hypothetical protein [Salinimicrobium sediminilitoris]|uniref:hypothetical protein n=1 Tax=Salinimicrobium sediminilitoris TaxID=2876715 RepID=UPI001E389AA7|nr:hypothetical protein [Salinimicrobium sediminilitoris]MCC8360277.1 hypothetical protein [Salinimicrobium sediminilitoris]
MEKKYFLFSRAGAGFIWDLDDLNAIAEAVNEDEAELFVYYPQTTPIHYVLQAYSRWSDYSYLTSEQYQAVVSRL